MIQPRYPPTLAGTIIGRTPPESIMVGGRYLTQRRPCWDEDYPPKYSFARTTHLSALASKIYIGDSAAETQLVDYFSSYVLKLLHNTFIDHQFCLDIYQETFTKVIVKLRLGQVLKPESLKSYISATALHLGYQNKRQWWNAASGNHQLVELLRDPKPTPFMAAVNDELNSLLRESIAKLHQARDRELLIGLYLEQKQKSIICNQCGLTLLQFDRAIYRARQRLKEIILETDLGHY